MEKVKSIAVKAFKLFIGALLGLLISFLIIILINVLMDGSILLSKPSANLWVIGIIIACFEFMCMFLLLRKGKSKKYKTVGINELPLGVSVLIDDIIAAMKYKHMRC